ncbi:MAG: hypothetical protein HY744_30020 [Deltaproteobacteria bacterium]|nr:hypothetical protein [Deltaproteobacteria bacterium]
MRQRRRARRAARVGWLGARREWQRGAGEAGAGPDPCAGAPLGDGTYCGSSLDPPGHANVLYECQAGATTASTPCEFGCAAKPPGTPDECAPDPASIPRGKGVWIWKFGTSAPPPAEVAAKADSLGVGFVLIKSGEDLSAYESNFNAQIVAEFTSRDMWVFAWNYVRPGNVPAKAAKIAQQTNIAGVKGMVLDVEIEWESTGAEQDAIDLCQAIRSQLEPDKMLGFSSFGWIDYHLGFPYAEFDAHCGDMHLPQTYWDAWSIGREQAYLKAVEGAKKLGLSAPIWAAQDFYEGDPTVEELNYFFALAGPFSNLWRWPNPGHTDLLEKMEQLDWPNY